jgi:hypothetical protein
MSGCFDLVGLHHRASGYLRGEFMYPKSSLLGSARYLFVNDHRLAAVVVMSPDFEVPLWRARVPSLPTLISLPDSVIPPPENELIHQIIVSIRLEQRPVWATWLYCADLA